MGRVLVVGISGTTNSGKSSLTNLLAKKIPNSTVVCQDLYFLPPGDSRLEPIYLPDINHHNWEDFRSLEMDRMVTEVNELISTKKMTVGDCSQVIFIEGYSIFGWRPLASLFDLKYFLSVEKDVCFERRQSRSYNPPDVAGYFEQYVWPLHLKHLEAIKDQTDIAFQVERYHNNQIYLDGNGPVDQHVDKILCDINKLTQANS